MATVQTIDEATQTATRLFLHSLADRYDVAGALLFGSRARGSHQIDSDADVALILRGPPQRFLPVKLDMSDRAFDVMLETGINISPLPIWVDEWDSPQNYVNPSLLKNIRAEGIPLL